MPTQTISGYAKRQSGGIASPPDTDSDDEFNPGMITIEEKKPKRGAKKTAAKKTTKRRKTSRGADSSEDYGDNQKRSKRSPAARQLDANGNPFNPLAIYFEEDLGFESADSDDDEAAAIDKALDDGDGSDSERRVINKDPPILRSFAVMETYHAKQMQAKSALAANSDTETESEAEDAVASSASLKRKCPTPNLPDAKRIKLATVTRPPADNSDTETESEDEVAFIPSASTAGKVSTTIKEDANSDTETEDEDEDAFEIYNPTLNARPGFPLKSGQPRLGPLLLHPAQKIRIPASINMYLRDYQRDGVRFFWDQYSQGLGGLLGDDMGLGKTIQVIAFLSALMHKHGDERDLERRKKHVSQLQDGKDWKKRKLLPPANATWPTCLIIAPSTVVHNWVREFETWGYFEVDVYTGPRKEREVVLNDFKKGRLDVVLTTFDIARRDIELLSSLPWSCVFVDEAHRVKNPSSKVTKAYNLFECTRRFGLTGTAIQNNYDELHTLLNWTNPGRLGTIFQWRGFISKPLTIGQSASATKEQRTNAAIVANVLHDKILPRYFLRRVKALIQDQLPKKKDLVTFCPLTVDQTVAYKRILALPAVENLVRKDELCECGSEKRRKQCCYKVQTADIFKYLAVLIKISNHLCLVLPGSSKDNADQTARNRELSRMVFDEPPKYGAAMMLEQYCGKWRTLRMLLNKWHDGGKSTDKVLIFTKSVKLIEMLDFHLKSKSYGFLTLDGSTKQSDRMPLIDQFNGDPTIFIFLISTLAGGTGLNLTAANKVVIFDPNWNPAHDLQAMDRAYRFGQTRDVEVYRLLGAGSVEELIYARQIYKQQQMSIGYDAKPQTRYFEGVQNDKSKQGELFGLKNLFSLQEGTSTKMKIETAHIAELDYALSNLSGKRLKKSVNSKLNQDDGENLGDLAALLFDDDEDVVENVNIRELKSIGVKYAHINDDLLQPSNMEADIAKEALQKIKKPRKSKTSDRDVDEDVPEWPPRRSRKKKKEIDLDTRRDALVGLGFISSPDGLVHFARKFAMMSDEQKQLDKWTPDSSGSD